VRNKIWTVWWKSRPSHKSGPPQAKIHLQLNPNPLVLTSLVCSRNLAPRPWQDATAFAAERGRVQQISTKKNGTRRTQLSNDICYPRAQRQTGSTPLSIYGTDRRTNAHPRGVVGRGRGGTAFPHFFDRGDASSTFLYWNSSTVATGYLLKRSLR